ncbi:hypothetical protein LEWO105114_01450 [Legionella worsleiensis]|nr:Uncharacterised protein [Legionella worsleiensis]
MAITQSMFMYFAHSIPVLRLRLIQATNIDAFITLDGLL